MEIVDFRDVVAEPVMMEGAEKVKVRWLIKEDAPNFFMRMFEIEPSGHTPFHGHDWEHEAFVMDGEGVCVAEDGGEHPITKGSVIYVPAGEKHSFRNSGTGILRFLCLVPSHE